MQRICKFLVIVLVSVLVLQPVLSLAGSSARLIPTGKAALMKDGKETSQFQSEMPLPEGQLISCKGNCLVQAENFQLVAHDKAVFAAAETGKQWELTVNEGTVEFAVGSPDKLLAFHTPDDIIRVEKIVSANKGPVRGYVSVTENGTEIKVQEGAIQLAGRNGSQMVEAGHSMIIARSEGNNAGKVVAAGAAAGAGGAAAAATGGGAAGVSGAALGAMGVVAAGVAAGIAVSGNGGGNQDVSPSGLDTKPK